QQRQREQGDETTTHAAIDGAYALHIFSSAQCFLLLAQALLCVQRKVRWPSLVKPGPAGKRSDAKPACTSNDLPHDPPLVVIIPSYHEDSWVLERTLNALVANNYSRSKLCIYLSFDGLDQIEEIDSVKNFLGLSHVVENGADGESCYETEFQGYRVVFSVFRHGGKRQCQKSTFEQIKRREEIAFLRQSCILLLDSDTFLQHDCIRNFLLTMGEQVPLEPGYHALSGITRVFRFHQSWLGLFQKLEYFYSQHFEREAEATCGAVHCLPGGLTMLTYMMLENCADEYFKDVVQAHDACFDYMKRSLGEDRWLTQLAIKRPRARGGIGLSRRAFCETVAPTTIMSFLAQRRRWFLGCIANEVSGMSDPDAWAFYPILSLYRIAHYAIGTPGFPFILTKFNLLRQTPYYRINLTLWVAAIALTWTTLIAIAGREDLYSAISYPVFLVLNPLQLTVAWIYAVLTMGHRTWGARTVPQVSKLPAGVPNHGDRTVKRLPILSDAVSLVAEMQDYLGRCHSSCASRVLRVLGVGSQVGEITCVLSDGIVVARKRSPSPTSTAGRAILQEIRILSRLSHIHVISMLKAQESGPSTEILLWPVAPCDLMVFLPKIHDADRGGPLDHELWQALGLLRPHRQRSSLDNARQWLRRSIGCLCSGVAYIHSQGIRHHDIRTQNILVTPRGPVLADFGGAVVLATAQTQTQNPPSTTQPFDSAFASDVLLLGCVVLELASAILGIDPRAHAAFDVMTDLRQTYEWNFVHNGARRARWVAAMRRCSHDALGGGGGGGGGLLDLAQAMLADDQARRPSAAQVVRALGGLAAAGEVLCGACCAAGTGGGV
ncbi:hypothetical protein MMC26_000224, partial [Xylographa opegraphella]|nr:hypothetical protein [Xylographa opegraphella]